MQIYSKSNLSIVYSPLSFLWQYINEQGKISNYFYQMSREDGREFLDIKTDLSPDEREYIESMIKPME